MGRGAGLTLGFAGLTDRRAPGGPGSLRLFVAVPLPEAAASEAATVLDGVGEAGRARGIRWVQSQGLHLTLRFLGAAGPDVVAPLAAALGEAALGVTPFRVTLAGAGAFPSLERPRVLWIGIRDGAARLGALARSLDEPFARAGWLPPERPFRPHLTVGRTDAASHEAGSAAARALIESIGGREISFDVHRVVLFQSHLGRGPARYQPLADVPLVAGAHGDPARNDRP